MNKFRVLYYNRFCNEIQTFNVMAKDENDAKRIFYLRFNKERYHECIENIYEVEEEHFHTEEEILKIYHS